MKLKQLKLAYFKNYHEQSAAFHDKFNLILGLNGMGKSNLLDAVHYCCLGKSYFSAIDKNVVNHDAEFFRLEANFTDLDQSSLKFVAKVIPGNSKHLELNNKELKKLSDYIGRIPCVIIAPKDVQALLDAAEERRTFVDATISQYDKYYLLALGLYQKLLKRRNALLKAFVEKSFFDKTLMETIDEKMVEPASYIFESRKEFLNEFGSYFTAAYQLICDKNETCTFEYKSALHYKDIMSLFAENLERDKIVGRTTAGIHKDDLELFIGNYALKPFASQGQIKSFIISMKLAQYNILRTKTNKLPILLLDDLLDKLDSNRVFSLLSLLSGENYGQVFITDTSVDQLPSLLAKLKKDFKLFRIEKGNILIESSHDNYSNN